MRLDEQFLVDIDSPGGDSTIGADHHSNPTVFWHHQCDPSGGYAVYIKRTDSLNQVIHDNRHIKEVTCKLCGKPVRTQFYVPVVTEANHFL